MIHEHWRYFLTLEQDFERTTRFVEPVAANFSTFSIEFARLLLATCSEIDVVAKVFCQAFNATPMPSKIDGYRVAISSQFPQFHTLKVELPRFAIDFQPWLSWGSGTNPSWWTDHNKVKHERHEHFARARLEASLHALGGLYALLLYLYREDLYKLRLAETKLFEISPAPSRIVAGGYRLPDFPKALV